MAPTGAKNQIGGKPGIIPPKHWVCRIFTGLVNRETNYGNQTIFVNAFFSVAPSFTGKAVNYVPQIDRLSPGEVVPSMDFSPKMDYIISSHK